MSADQIVTILGSLGFPAVAAVAMWLWVKEQLSSQSERTYEREKRLYEDIRTLRGDLDALQADVRDRLVGLIEKNEHTLERTNSILGKNSAMMQKIIDKETS